MIIINCNNNRQEEEIAVQLLGMGADVSVQNNKQRTPLHNAAYNNMIQTLQLLLCMEADVNVKVMGLVTECDSVLSP